MSNEQQSRRRRLPLLISLAVAIAIGAGFAASQLVGAEDAAAAEPAPPPDQGEVVTVEAMLVNLADDEPRYARVGMALVLAPEVPVAEVETHIPLLKDAALTILTSTTSAELRSPGGLQELRARLTDAAGEVWPAGEVVQVVLTEMVVQ